MKMNIFQLAKAARRLRARRLKIEQAIRHTERRKASPEFKEGMLKTLFKRIGLVDSAEGELRVELMQRRAGYPGCRVASPKKIQRAEGRLPAV